MGMTFNQKLYQAERKLKKISDDYNRMVEEYTDKFKKEVNKICISTIQDFYDDYDQRIYHRKHSLFDVYHIDIDQSGYEISFDFSDMASHRVTNEYIFNIAFEGGWHGGAPKNGGYSENSVLYYRRPVPEYYEWGRRAKRSSSPYKTIVKSVNEKINSLKEEVDREFTKTVRSPLNEITEMFRRG